MTKIKIKHEKTTEVGAFVGLTFSIFELLLRFHHESRDT